MAKKLDISDRSLRRIVNESLWLRPCKIQRRHLLSSASKQKCFDRGNKILEEMQCAAVKVFFWSDEDFFTVEFLRYLVLETFPEVFKTHFKRQEPWDCSYVWGFNSPFVFIEVNRVNQHILKRVMLPSLSSTFERRYVFTQNGNPVQKANLMQNSCKRHFRECFEQVNSV